MNSTTSTNNEQPPPHQPPLPPIVFVHGWKASVLTDKTTGEEKFTYDNKLWQLVTGRGGGGIIDLPMEWNDDNNNGSINHQGRRQVMDNLQPSHPCYNVKIFGGCYIIQQLYGPLIQHLKKSGREVHLFTYDWRRELDETSQLLEEFLEERFGQQKTTTTTTKPQVVAHSMGCLITLHCYVHRPDLFHSVLWGAGALGPSICRMEDFSIYGGTNNTLVNNSNIFTPASNLSNPSGIHFFQMLPNERELFFGKNNLHPASLLYDAATGHPIQGDLELHKLSTWKKYKVGMYHPDSNIAVTPAKEAWMQSVLDRAYKFRSGLFPDATATLPPTAVLNSNGLPTKVAFCLQNDGTIDLTGPVGRSIPGDGLVSYQDSVPPLGVPVIQTITNQAEHTQVLNDVENVDKLLKLLLKEVETKAREGLGH